MDGQMSGSMIVAIASATASLFLAMRALRAHGLSFENKAWMAVAWTLIIAVLAFAAGRLGA